MATLHRAAFVSERPWSAAEFSELIESRFTHCYDHAHGFALARTLAGETELLALAVDPAHHRRGIGRTLTEEWLNASIGEAATAFLEVAEDNAAASALYLSLGFRESGRRPAYYARKNAAAVDAIVMSRVLTLGQGGISARPSTESG
ncbi:MAG: GNAT family N-acetyltransferase [Sulfitobacter sp.]